MSKQTCMVHNQLAKANHNMRMEFLASTTQKSKFPKLMFFSVL